MNKLIEQLKEARAKEDDGLVQHILDQIFYLLG